MMLQTVRTLTSASLVVLSLHVLLSAQNINLMVEKWMTVLDPAQECAPRTTQFHRNGTITVWNILLDFIVFSFFFFSFSVGVCVCGSSHFYKFLFLMLFSSLKMEK